jgi:pectate lyase
MYNSTILDIIIITIIINSFFIGYLFGRSANLSGVYNITKTESFFKKQNSEIQKNNSICIDDKKFVTEIKTNNLEKKYDSLGDIKQTQDNITNSVNKLKNLKG